MAEQFALPPETAQLLAAAKETLTSVEPVKVVDDASALLAGKLIYTLREIKDRLQVERRRLVAPHRAAIAQIEKALNLEPFEQQDQRLRQQLYAYSDCKAQAARSGAAGARI